MVRCSAVLILIIFFTSCCRAQGKKGIRPDFLQVQYAGSIGYLSVGAGYNVIRDKALTSLQFGHVPHYAGGPLNIFSGRFLFVPHTYRLSDRVTLSPYNTGLTLSYHFGSNFRTTWPDHRYPARYYWWQTSFRLHLNLQPAITVRLSDHTIFKSMSAYVDLNSNELYAVSFGKNPHAISFWDILMLGAGIRLNY
jgi:hypothetical protein